MPETVRITVAPGCHVTITPHPAGVAALGGLTLGSGNTADVSRVRAAELYRAGLILDPMTGALPPAPEPMRANRMTITIEGGPPRFADGGMIHAEPPSEPLVLPTFSLVEPMSRTNHDHGLMPHPSLTTCGPSSSDPMSTITTADGRAWPSF